MVNKQFIAQNRPAEKPAADMSVSLSGLRLDNPVVPASGTFGYGNEFRDFYDINILGSFSFKGTTRDARFGNPTPRIAECTAGMINAVGLQNPGIDAVIAEELPRLKTFFHKPVIANISGFSIEEYAYCCERIDREPQVGIIEVNVSCPNVRHGGMSFGTSPECAAEVTRAVKAVTTKPVYIKLSPNVTDIVAIARACEGESSLSITTSSHSLFVTISFISCNLPAPRKLRGSGDWRVCKTMATVSAPAVSTSAASSSIEISVERSSASMLDAESPASTARSLFCVKS